jgi:glycerol-3-phosphate acyltransferase PlsY
VTFFTKYITLGTLAGAFVAVLASLLLVDNDIVLKLILIAGGLTLIKHIPSISRILNGREEKLSFEEDITYKLDQKF